MRPTGKLPECCSSKGRQEPPSGDLRATPSGHQGSSVRPDHPHQSFPPAPSLWNLPRVCCVLGCVSTRLIEVELAIPEERHNRLVALYSAHGERAGRLAYLLTGDVDLAEDVAQEALVRLIARIRFIPDDAVIATYLRRAVVNLVRNHWRKVGTERAYLRREGPRSVSRSTVLPDIAARDEMWRALGTLPYRQRAAIVLRFYEDLSESETARVLGCAVGTVKSSVNRGLQRLREEMIGDDGVRA
jgi:RNA polymerase sigma-70 factor (sigma-E family)